MVDCSPSNETPDIVYGLRAVLERRDTSWHVRLTWVAGGFSAIQGYRVFSRCAAQPWSVLVNNTGVGAASVVLGPLSPAVYEFGVAALSEHHVAGPISVVGCGIPSTRNAIAGDLDASAVPIPLPGRPLDFTCQVGSTTAGSVVSFNLAWIFPSNAVAAEVSHHAIVVQWDCDVNGVGSFRVAIPSPSSTVRLASLPSGRNYIIKIISVGSSGEGPSRRLLVNVPSVPSSPCASTTESSTSRPQLIMLRWPLLDCDDTPVVGYRIWCRATGCEDWRVLVGNTGSPEPSTICAVPRDVEHEFSVAAITPRSPSPPRQTASAHEAENSLAVQRLPGVVQNLRAEEHGQTTDENATVVLSWDAPVITLEGGPPVLAYDLAVHRGAANAISMAQRPIHSRRLEASCTSAAMAGLFRGVEYTFVVVAVCEHGGGVEAACSITLLGSEGHDGARQQNSDVEVSNSGLSTAQNNFRAAMSRRWTDPNNEVFVLPLKRDTFFEDTVALLGAPTAAANYMQPHHLLQVRFEGEAGVDQGGLLREWFCLVFRESSRAELGIFEALENAKGHIWPSVVGWQVGREDAEPVLRLLGRLVGLALVSCSSTGFAIHPIFWQWAMSLGHDDAEEVDYFLALKHFDRAQFLQRARLVYSRSQLAAALGINMDDLAVLLPDWRPMDAEEVAALELTWDYDETVCGTLLSCPLHRQGSGGEKAIVTKADASEYLKLWSRQRIIGSAEQQLLLLREGLLEVLAPEDLTELVADELRELAVGVGWNVEELLPHIQVLVVRDASNTGGNSSAADLITWLEEILNGFTVSQRDDFLQYVTGSSWLPAGGAVQLQPKLTFQVIPNWPIDLLPVAHTCANLLDMPLYPDLATFRARLLTALQFVSHGFGLA